MALLNVEAPIPVAGRGAMVALKGFWMLEGVAWWVDVVARELATEW